MIYLQKDEEVFVKYGDEEAALYNAAEEQRLKEEAERAKNPK